MGDGICRTAGGELEMIAKSVEMLERKGKNNGSDRACCRYGYLWLAGSKANSPGSAYTVEDRFLPHRPTSAVFPVRLLLE